MLGFHTTAVCTTGTVSLGRRGRCFFNAGVVVATVEVEAEEEDDGGVALALGTAVRLIVAAVGVVKETIVTGTAMEDWVETLEGVEGAVLVCDGSVDGVKTLPAVGCIHVTGQES